jgi:formate dehydrogenase gamma subunit
MPPKPCELMRRPEKKLLLVVWLFGFTLPASNGMAQNNQTCLTCHSDKSLTMKDTHGRQVSAYVDAGVFAASVHGFLQCKNCHQDIVAIPHPEKLKKVNCGSCHEDAMKAFRAGIHGEDLAGGDPDAPTCSSCHGEHNILPPSDPKSRVYPLNQPATCGRCHANKNFIRRHKLPSGEPVGQYENSVHAEALRHGVKDAPSCSTCHRAHDILPPSDLSSPINRSNVQVTCGKCHGAIEKVYAGSIHGVALHEGFSSAPTCNTCHGEHNIQSPTKAEAATNPTKVSQEVCTPCHSSVVLNQKFGLRMSQVSSYFGSYHGLAVSRGSTVAANCTSCHGIHDIYAPSDSRSSVNPANLEKTCGKCHPGAGESFAKIPVHGQREQGGTRIAEIIGKIYIVLIVVVVSGMLIHNFVIYCSAVVAKHRNCRQEQTVQRFSFNMRIQHMILFAAFTTLVVTGFALKFPSVFQILDTMGIGEHSRGIIHRAAASALMAAGLYHVCWVLFRRRGRAEFRAIMPTSADLVEFLAALRYYLGRTGERPHFGRYKYAEKMEYWALIWGTVIMSFTGFALWFPVGATNFFGSWITPVATVIHYYEAILATLAIVVWHFFFTIFHPDEYPMSLVWITGKVTKEEVKEHRPRWYKEVEEELKDNTEKP